MTSSLITFGSIGTHDSFCSHKKYIEGIYSHVLLFCFYKMHFQRQSIVINQEYFSSEQFVSGGTKAGVLRNICIILFAKKNLYDHGPYQLFK